MKSILFVLICVINPFNIFAQAKLDETVITTPKIGKRMPDFNLTDVVGYKSNKVTLMDFAGKWLVMDFWTKGCKACVAAFPKLNQFQKDFKREVQFLLIANNDEKHNKGIRAMYEKFKVKQGLDLTIAYDSVLFAQFNLRSFPLYIIIDSDGIVRSMTFNISEEYIRKLIHNTGNRATTEDIVDASNLQKSLWITDTVLGEGDIFKSHLAKWNNTQHQVFDHAVDEDMGSGYLYVAGSPLRWLYNYAYIGVQDWGFRDSLYETFHRFPIWDLSDSLSFEDEFVEGKNVFNYSFAALKENLDVDKFRQMIQNDLKSKFGYEVLIEVRKMAYWKLTATETAKQMLLTKGASQQRIGDHAGLKLVNVPVDDLLWVIFGYFQSESPFINETGINGNIDIEIDAVMTDFEDVSKALQKRGLILSKCVKEMKVLVFR